MKQTTVFPIHFTDYLKEIPNGIRLAIFKFLPSQDLDVDDINKEEAILWVVVPEYDDNITAMILQKYYSGYTIYKTEISEFDGRETLCLYAKPDKI